MSEITDREIETIGNNERLKNRKWRENFADFKNRHNQLDLAVQDSQNAAPANEEVNARAGYASLLDRLNETNLQRNYVLHGFEVRARDTAAMSVVVSAGRAVVGGVFVRKGYGVWSRSGTAITITEEGHGRSNGQTVAIDACSDVTSIPLGEYPISGVTTNTFTITGVDRGDIAGTVEIGTITSTLTAPAATRYDVVVINSSNAIEVVSGTNSSDPVLPDLTSVQRGLAQITLTSATTSITNSLIRDCSVQGAWTEGRYYWKIQEAVDTLNDRSNSEELGEIHVRKGRYFEEVDLTNKRNIAIRFENGAKMYRKDSSSRCIKANNAFGVATTSYPRLSIYGGEFYGNGKAGASTNLYFSQVYYLELIDVWSDGNTSSSGFVPGFDTGIGVRAKDLVLINCHALYIDGGQTKSRYWKGGPSSTSSDIEDPPQFPDVDYAADSGNVETSVNYDQSDIVVGGIIAWHASIVPNLTTPDGWFLMDGSRIEDHGTPMRRLTPISLTDKGIVGSVSMGDTGVDGLTGINGLLNATNSPSSDFVAMRWLMRII